MARAHHLTAGLLVLGACTTPIIESNDTNDDDSETSSGDGDGDPGDGDGDGDPGDGDGDGDPGDGDGDPGDGDGDGTGVGECGDGIVDPGEACDDGINDGSYDGCAPDCTLGPFCGDAELNGPEECDDGNQIPTDGCFDNCLLARSCKDIDSFISNAPTGPSTIDVDGPGPTAPLDVWCEQDLDGGGWQLITVRHGDVDTLFADNICVAVDGDCSGTIPAAQIGQSSPKLLLATLSGEHWLRLDGLDAPGDDGLIDMITLLRLLSDTDSCMYPHFCNEIIDATLEIAAHSPSWTPRSLTMTSQYGRWGGLWYAEGGGQAMHHVFSFNFSSNLGCNGGLTLSDNSDATVGNVACAQPGAMYFRY